ncbi:hypothetical protein HQ945_08975 [Phyllobacterium sp. BT25]|uniref:Uncharacterized protein n=1 Tax=Phyllobacterium pellucidum TaxID=2740464 RepID=A0A849VQV5_9HYPH|nr:hypothetical protein [Phyllobacterium pellucidum]NTS31384.1 hypothetical protein [Phyllobacterium pellucidum]
MSALLANAAFHAINAAVEPSLEDQIADAEARIYIAERRSDPYMRQREIERWTRHLRHLEEKRSAL